jgi:hypothetical protein
MPKQGRMICAPQTETTEMLWWPFCGRLFGKKKKNFGNAETPLPRSQIHIYMPAIICCSSVLFLLSPL